MMTVFDALTDPSRRQILDYLRMRPHHVGELVTLLNMSQPGISKHLRSLREAGLVEVRHDAQRRWYALRPEPLQELDAWLAPYRDLWEQRFSRLDSLLADLQNKEQDE
jgi:DNA-binding transcriptional ArsR family regulator